MGNIKETNIKNRTYYFLNDVINIKNIDSNLLKLDKRSYKIIDIYYIRYIIRRNIGDYESVHSVNSLYFIIGEVDGYIEENNGNKYLVFASADKNKEVLKNILKV